jgi:hypothetical protein
MSSMEDLERTMAPQAMKGMGPTGRRRRIGEGREGAIIGIVVVVAIGLFIAAILLIPGFLEWILSIGFWLLILLLVVFILGGLIIAFIVAGVSIFYLARKTEYQGPEVSYTLDMVKEPPKGNA